MRGLEPGKESELAYLPTRWNWNVTLRRTATSVSLINTHKLCKKKKKEHFVRAYFIVLLNYCRDSVAVHFPSIHIPVLTIWVNNSPVRSDEETSQLNNDFPGKKTSFIKVVFFFYFSERISFVDTDDVQVAREDKEGKITCSVRGDPTPSVNWYFNGMPLNSMFILLLLYLIFKCVLCCCFYNIIIGTEVRLVKILNGLSLRYMRIEWMAFSICRINFLNSCESLPPPLVQRLAHK